MNHLAGTEARFRVDYRLSCRGDESAEAKAEKLALEQTVELPKTSVPQAILRCVAGHVERLEDLDDGIWKAEISYPEALVAGDIGQLLNLLFGNVSMQSGVLVKAVEWTDSLLSALGGPRLGIPGLRGICQVPDRALTCAALKPAGLSAEDLAARCESLALGGIDIIKDDHSMADQVYAPFRERVELCQQAVDSVAQTTGRASLYFPHVSGDWPEMMRRLEFASAVGCRGVLVNPLIIGLGGIRRLADKGSVAVLGHPALAGAFFCPDHGLDPGLLLGELFRLAGCDGVIFPNFGGRFALPKRDCERIVRMLRAPLGEIESAIPVPAGGIAADRVEYWVERLGADSMLLLGGSLYEQGDLVEAARRFVAALRT